MLKARHQSPADLQNSRAVNWAKPNFVRKQRRHSSLGARAKRPKTSRAACEIESNRGKRQRSNQSQVTVFGCSKLLNIGAIGFTLVQSEKAGEHPSTY